MQPSVHGDGGRSARRASGGRRAEKSTHEAPDLSTRGLSDCSSHTSQEDRRGGRASPSARLRHAPCGMITGRWIILFFAYPHYNKYSAHRHAGQSRERHKTTQQALEHGTGSNQRTARCIAVAHACLHASGSVCVARAGVRYVQLAQSRSPPCASTPAERLANVGRLWLLPFCGSRRLLVLRPAFVVLALGCG